MSTQSCFQITSLASIEFKVGHLFIRETRQFRLQLCNDLARISFDSSFDELAVNKIKVILQISGWFYCVAHSGVEIQSELLDEDITIRDDFTIIFFQLVNKNIGDFLKMNIESESVFSSFWWPSLCLFCSVYIFFGKCWAIILPVIIINNERLMPRVDPGREDCGREGPALERPGRKGPALEGPGRSTKRATPWIIGGNDGSWLYLSEKRANGFDFGGLGGWMLYFSANRGFFSILSLMDVNFFDIDEIACWNGEISSLRRRNDAAGCWRDDEAGWWRRYGSIRGPSSNSFKHDNLIRRGTIMSK